MKLSKLDSAQIEKVLKVAVYVAVSAFISALIANLASNPDLFGPLTPIVNVILVAIKQVFTTPEE